MDECGQKEAQKSVCQSLRFSNIRTENERVFFSSEFRQKAESHFCIDALNPVPDPEVWSPLGPVPAESVGPCLLIHFSVDEASGFHMQRGVSKSQETLPAYMPGSAALGTAKRGKKYKITFNKGIKG